MTTHQPEWQHHPDLPGMFASVDGRHWLVLDDDGWLIVGAAGTDGAHVVESGPFGDPTDCGVTEAMAEEAELKSIEAAFAQTEAGKPISFRLTGPLGAGRKP